MIALPRMLKSAVVFCVGVMTSVFFFTLHLCAQVGSPDPMFTTQITGSLRSYFSVHALAVQDNGKILVGGAFSQVNGVSRLGLARLHTDGSLDATFEPGDGADNTVLNIVVQPDQRILVGGVFNALNGHGPGLVRLNTAGSVDTNFNFRIPMYVYALAYHPSGKIYIAESSEVLRLNLDGSVDSSFFLEIHPDGLSGGNSYVQQFVVQPDGKTVFCGDFLYVNGDTRASVARLNADGTLDPSFVPDSMATWWSTDALGLRADGFIYTGSQGVAARINRLFPCGRWDTNFVQPDQGSLFIDTIAVQSDGKPIIGGNFEDLAGRNALGRFNVDGSVDESFSGYVDGQVEEVLVQSDGRILIGGAFRNVNGTQHTGIARLLGDAPVLDRARVAPGQLVLSWPSAYTNHVLQSCTTFSTGDWMTVSNATIASSGGMNSVTNEIASAGAKFFRLMKP